MVPEALPYDADPISQIRFPETSSHLHAHTKLHVLRLHEPSLEAANTFLWCISARQTVIFTILDEAPGVEGLVALVPVRRCLFDG
jgi:hypothetical protein